MHTKDILAEALRWAGLPDMANKAAAGYYHDYLSPLPFPEMQLISDLNEAKEKAKDKRQIRNIDVVIERHMRGAFDATTKESEDWIKSKDGQETFKELIKPKKK